MAGRVWSAIAKLRAAYGPMRAVPRDPFALIVYENCAYLVGDRKRRLAYDTLKRSIGLTPRRPGARALPDPRRMRLLQAMTEHLETRTDAATPPPSARAARAAASGVGAAARWAA